MDAEGALPAEIGAALGRQAPGWHGAPARRASHRRQGRPGSSRLPARADRGTGRVLVACVGNALRRDDGFGVAVARWLATGDPLPPTVDLIETGIGGLSIVHQLMNGYQALIVVDAVDRGVEPGTISVFEPDVLDPTALAIGQWQAQFSNLHLVEPSRVFALAKALGVLPGRVLLVGCQPQDSEEMGESLSPPVEAAVEVAARRVRDLIGSVVESER